MFFPRLFSDEDCDAIIAAGEEYLEPSRIDSGYNNNVRSSLVYFFDASHEYENEDLFLRIKSLTANLSHVPIENGEGVQLQKYLAPRVKKFDMYEPHYDSMEGDMRRVATWIIYLTDVEEGGETIFPLLHRDSIARVGHSNLNNSFVLAWANKHFKRMCDPADTKTLKIKPRKGSAVLFYTLTPGGQHDPLTVHASCPVLKGTKYVAQQWFKERLFIARYSPYRAVFRARGTGCITNSKLAHIGNSRAMTITFMVNVPKCHKPRQGEGKQDSVTVEIPGAGRFGVRFTDECQIAALSPDVAPDGKSSATVAQGRVKPGWSFVTLVVENTDFDVGPPKKWHFRQYLLVESSLAGSRDGHLDASGARWSETSVCVEAGGLIDVRELHVMTRQMGHDELKQMQLVSSQDRVAAERTRRRALAEGHYTKT